MLGLRCVTATAPCTGRGTTCSMCCQAMTPRPLRLSWPYPIVPSRNTQGLRAGSHTSVGGARCVGAVAPGRPPPPCARPDAKHGNAYARATLVCSTHCCCCCVACQPVHVARSVPCLRGAWVVCSLSAAGGLFVPRVQVLVCARCGVAEHLDEGHTVVPLASAGADAEAVIASALPQLAACADRLQGTVAQVQVCPVRAVISMLVCGQA